MWHGGGAFDHYGYMLLDLSVYKDYAALNPNGMVHEASNLYS